MQGSEGRGFIAYAPDFWKGEGEVAEKFIRAANAKMSGEGAILYHNV